MAAGGFKVGLLFSSSSLSAAVETTQANATRLAIDEVNAAGGIDGVELQAVACDTGPTPDHYRQSAQRLCDEDQVRVLFGTHMSSTRKAVLPIIESRHRLLFYPTLYEGFEYSPNCFYTGAAPNQNSVQLARHALSHFGKRVFFIGCQYVYPYESNRIMRDLFEQAGGEVVGEIYLPFFSSLDDFRAVMNKVRDAAPDAIYSTTVGSDIPTLYRAYREAGFDPARMPILSQSTNEAEIALMPAEVAEGHICVAPWFDTVENPASREFVRRYRARHGADAPITSGAEAAYFQVHLFALAARQVPGGSLEELREALAQVRFTAPQGEVWIDAQTQHTWLWPRVARVDRNGRFVIIEESPAAVRPSPYMIDHQLHA
ncbi:transporter substrate-binding domain-containing protein [Pseudomonas sp. LRF_L74]|uniref:transporter substrate-binding domain-containing protein n=1 Tax=Pseudomonas sp. LRF_L74 TaxID=3369422 RepID=UPI003F5FC0D1